MFPRWTLSNFKTLGFPVATADLSNTALAVATRFACKTCTIWKVVFLDRFLALKNEICDGDPLERTILPPKFLLDWIGNSVHNHLKNATLVVRNTSDKCNKFVDNAAWTDRVQAKMVMQLTEDRNTFDFQDKLRERLCLPRGDPKVPWFVKEDAKNIAQHGLKIITRINKLHSTPYIRVAILRLWFNGWNTSERFQLENKPCVCCKAADSDSLYALYGVRIVWEASPRMRRFRILR